jgi:hypothetical protein
MTAEGSGGNMYMPVAPAYNGAAAYEEENMRMKERLKQIMSDTPDERTRRMLQELAEQ